MEALIAKLNKTKTVNLIKGIFPKIRNQAPQSDNFFTGNKTILQKVRLVHKQLISVKPFKQLTLILTSLLVVAFSFSFTKAFDPSTSIQSNSIENHLTALAADDIDDDFTDPEFQLIYHCDLPSSPWLESSLVKIAPRNSNSNKASTPVYLQIRNLRI